MRAVVQRVHQAEVHVENKVVGSISRGLLIYLGVGIRDTENDLNWLVNKVAGLRIFPDENDHMNRSLIDIQGDALVISQFTLFGDVRRGKRPSFTNAMAPDTADQIYQKFCRALAKKDIHVEQGVFGAMMDVRSVNAGPVTILVDSEKKF